MKKLREMTSKEFGDAVDAANKEDFSDYAKFCSDSIGYCFYHKSGLKLDKWEVFFMGYKNAEYIISGNETDVIAVKRENNLKYLRRKAGL